MKKKKYKELDKYSLREILLGTYLNVIKSVVEDGN